MAGYIWKTKTMKTCSLLQSITALLFPQDIIFPVIKYLFSFLIPPFHFFCYQSTNFKNAMTNQGDLVAAMHQTSFFDHSQVTALLVSHACFGDKWQPQPFLFQAARVYHLDNQENNSVLLSRVSIVKFEQYSNSL